MGQDPVDPNLTPWQTVAVSAPRRWRKRTGSLGPGTAAIPAGVGGPSDTGDRTEERRAVVRATVVALWAWPSFHLLDLFMIAALYPSASYAPTLALRVFNQLLLVVTYTLARNGRGSAEALRWIHGASYALMGFSISLMAVSFGGLHSAYVHGISIVVLGRSMLIPSRFGRALAESAITIGAFPLVMAVAAQNPRTGVTWGDGHSLALFASNFIFPVGSTVVGALCSEMAWAAQRQIYRARRIGRYRLEAPIGRGGMGEMWLAWDESLRRGVALRLLRSSSERPLAVARFEREARAASQLGCPHSIRIFDFGSTDDGIHFIAMEYLAGADLDSIVKAFGPLSSSRTIYLLLQACSALIESHEAGIVHRDIKPGNLFVARIGDRYDFLKVLDFGIACLINTDPQRSPTTTGFTLGTPAYMAPELRLGRAADARSDVYSLGATMYFLLQGFPPRDPLPLPAAQSWPGSRRLQAIVECCLQPDADRRFQNVRALQRALASCADVEPWTDEDAATFWQVAQLRTTRDN